MEAPDIVEQNSALIAGSRHIYEESRHRLKAQAVSGRQLLNAPAVGEMLVLKAWRRACRHDDTFCAASVPESMRQAAIESVCTAFSQDLHLVADCDFKTALQNNATFLCIVAEHRLACVGGSSSTLTTAIAVSAITPDNPSAMTT